MDENIQAAAVLNVSINYVVRRNLNAEKHMKLLKIELYNAPYYQLLYGDDVFGMVEKVDGGYLVIGKRKPVETLKDAAKQLLDKQMSRCLAEHEKYRKTLRSILDT